MAQYAFLIYEEDTTWPEGAPETEQVLKEHAAFTERNGAALRGGAWLHPISTATFIRKDGSGDFTVTDAAFAETKEVLGGFYLVEASDLDEAIEMAKQVPAAAGGIEVRPLREP